MKMSRAKELVDNIIYFLADWCESDQDACCPVDESIAAIESYETNYEQPDDNLVFAAVRHLKDIVNPWNDDSLSEIMLNLGFTVDEIDKFSPAKSIVYISFGIQD